MEAARTFRQLAELLDRDPDSYREVVDRLKKEDPDRFEAFVAFMRGELARIHAEDDRPLADREVEEVIDRTAEELGWPRARVMSEAIMRLRAAITDDGHAFRPVTPERDPAKRSGRYVRRMSSIRALVSGDVAAVLEKHRRRARRDPRSE